MPLEYPLSANDKSIVEQTKFAELKALKFKGGLPVFTAVPTYVGSDGEMVLLYSSTTYQLYSYLNEGWRKVGDSGFLTSAGTGFLTDVVNDTTPQLGGDLDLNGKNIDFPSTANISDVLDEDTMTSNSATKLATQQSIKAYVDNNITGFELVSNKSSAVALGTSNTLYPTQNAVKTYVDSVATAEYKYVGTGGLTSKLYYNFALDFGDSDEGGADDIFTTTGILTTDFYAGGMYVTPDGQWTMINTNPIFLVNWGGAAQDNKTIIVEFAATFNAGTGGEQSAVGITTGTNTLIDYDDQTADAVSISINGGDVYGHTSNAGAGHTETGLSGSLTITNMNLYRIEFDPGVSAKFYVNGTLRATITTNLPDGAGGLKFGLGGTTAANGVIFISKPVFSIEI